MASWSIGHGGACSGVAAASTAPCIREEFQETMTGGAYRAGRGVTFFQFFKSLRRAINPDLFEDMAAHSRSVQCGALTGSPGPLLRRPRRRDYLLIQTTTARLRKGSVSRNCLSGV